MFLYHKKTKQNKTKNRTQQKTKHQQTLHIANGRLLSSTSQIKNSCTLANNLIISHIHINQKCLQLKWQYDQQKGQSKVP